MTDSTKNQLFSYITGYRTTQALFVASKLGIADLLYNCELSCNKLAEITNSNSKALYSLMRALASIGVFKEISKGTFSNTDLSEQLREEAKDTMYYSILFHGNLLYKSWEKLESCVQNGQNGFDKIYNDTFFNYLEKNDTEAEIFDSVMQSKSYRDIETIVKAYDFSNAGKIVDIGGGYGQLLIEMLKIYPNLNGVVYDLKHVVKKALAANYASNFENNCQYISGDFFKSIPTGDTFLLKHILHDWNDDEATKILQNCRRSINENGKILLIEMLITSGNQPHPVKWLDLNMLVLFGSYERSKDEYEALLNNAGFKLDHVISDINEFTILEAIPTD